MFSLDNKVVVITGGGGVLAGKIATVVAKCGAQVALVDIDLHAANQVAEPMSRAGLDAVSVEADVCDGESLEKARHRVISRFGKIDCLINAAGGNQPAATTSSKVSFFDISRQAWAEALDLNFTGTLLSCQVFGKEIVRLGVGSIVNVSSIAGCCALTRAAGYSAAKAAISNFSAWLAVHMCHEYSPRIRVNAVCPGFFATRQNRYLLFDEEAELTERGRAILKAVPQGRFGQPRELASAVVWLLSDSSSFVTGSTITIDGGFSAFSGV